MKVRVLILCALGIFVVQCDKDEKTSNDRQEQVLANDDEPQMDDANKTPEASPAAEETPPSNENTEDVTQPETLPESTVPTLKSQNCLVETSTFKTCIQLTPANDTYLEEITGVFSGECTEDLNGKIVETCPIESDLGCSTKRIMEFESESVTMDMATEYYDLSDAQKNVVENACKENGTLY